MYKESMRLAKISRKVRKKKIKNLKKRVKRKKL
jgi:hypothetical protein